MQNSCKQNKKQTSFCFHDHHDLDDACKTLPAHSPFNFGSVWLLGAMSTDTAEPQTDAKMFPGHFDSTHHDDDRDHDPKWTITFDAAIWNQKKRRRGRALPKKQPGKETIFQNFFLDINIRASSVLGHSYHFSCSLPKSFQLQCRRSCNVLLWALVQRDLESSHVMMHRWKRYGRLTRISSRNTQTTVVIQMSRLWWTKKAVMKVFSRSQFLVDQFYFVFFMRLIFFA